MSDEVWYPTVAFGFDSKDKLNQMWVSNLGTFDWRPVPMIELGKKRPAAVAGFVPEEDENE